MPASWFRTDARTALAFALVPGLVVAGLIAPKDGAFWAHLLFYWAPQGCAAALVCVMFGAPRWPVVAGIAIGLTGYLAAYAGAVAMWRPDVADAWLAYYYAVPGACAGAMAAAVWPGDGWAQGRRSVIATSAVFAFAGAAASLAIFWAMIG